jgi:hypothetical protein
MNINEVTLSDNQVDLIKKLIEEKFDLVSSVPLTHDRAVLEKANMLMLYTKLNRLP